jgi:Tol biopolymer transport system component
LKKYSLSILVLVTFLSCLFLMPIVFIVEADWWSAPIQLTYNSFGDHGASISANGAKIAFFSYVDVGGSEIFVANADGSSSPQQLTSNGDSNFFPSISGDGGKIVYESHVDGDGEIFIVNSDGTGLTQLTNNAANDGSPVISGDGSKIAFRSNVDGDYEIFIVNSDGTGLTQLTNNAANDGSPVISGDGSKIAFTSNIDGEIEIYVMNSDGTELTQLTVNTAFEDYISISNDGSKIAFTSDIDGDGEIFIVNSDGTGLTQLTINNAEDTGPSISGDGTKIAFLSYVAADYDGEIFIVNSDGTGLTQLTNNWVFDSSPSISGDGTKIAYESGEDTEIDIFVVVMDITPPTGSIFISDDETFTISTSVTLTLAASDAESGAGEMRFSNNNVTWSDWQVYATSAAWTLTSGDGIKTVYYQVKDNAGLKSPIYSDTITLDTSVPIGSVSINEGDEFTTSTSVILSLTYEDGISGVDQVRFSNDGVWDTEDWEAPTTTKAWTLTSEDGIKSVYYQIKDNAGLGSTTYSDTITLNPTLSASLTPTSKSVATGAAATFTVTGSGGTPPYTYQWYENGNIMNGQTSTQLTVTKTATGTYEYYCKVTDTVENSTDSNIALLTITTGPTPTSTPKPTTAPTSIPTTSPTNPPATPPPSTSPTPTFSSTPTSIPSPTTSFPLQETIAIAGVIITAIVAIILFRIIRKPRKPPALARYPKSSTSA